MDQQHPPTAEHDNDHEDHGGVGKYVAVFVCLCVLTGASFFTVSDYWPFQDTPAVGRAFMMAVSCSKAMLVILFFMHLLWEANWKYVLTSPAAMMSLFLLLMLVPDVGCRRLHYSAERVIHAAQPVLVHSSEHGEDHSEEVGHDGHEADDQQHGDSSH